MAMTSSGELSMTTRKMRPEGLCGSPCSGVVGAASSLMSFSLGMLPLDPAEGQMGGPSRQQRDDDTDDAVCRGIAMGEFEDIGTDAGFGNHEWRGLRAGDLPVTDQQHLHQIA